MHDQTPLHLTTFLQVHTPYFGTCRQCTSAMLLSQNKWLVKGKFADSLKLHLQTVNTFHKDYAACKSMAPFVYQALVLGVVLQNRSQGIEHPDLTMDI